MIAFLHAVVEARIGTLSAITERIIRTCQLVHHVRFLLVLELCHLTRVKLRIPFSDLTELVLDVFNHALLDLVVKVGLEDKIDFPMVVG